MLIVICPDSFKGTLTAAEAGHVIAEAWGSVRPGDELRIRPLADGGEGSLAVIAANSPGARWVETGPVFGPGGSPVQGRYLLLPDDIAVVELAVTSGLTLLDHLDAVGATSRGVGDVIDCALADGARSVVLALGGSASTDGGTGLLSALGVQFLDSAGCILPDGGGYLRHLYRIDLAGLISAPPAGVQLLVDVDAPLLGPRGAALTFSPQKGASPDDVQLLESGLRRLADVVGGDVNEPGCGAAGGTAYGVKNIWGAEIVSGARIIADIAGIDDEIRWADLVITGEGLFDISSLSGKIAGEVLSRAGRFGVQVVVVCGDSDVSSDTDFVPGSGYVRICSAREVAGSREVAIGAPGYWVGIAAANLAAIY